MKFGSGPKISVHVEMVKGAIVSSRLALSDSFICTGADEVLFEWLSSYVKGKAPLLPLTSGTAFQQKVMSVMKQIPFGQTKTYGELARLCDRPNAARAVGGACKQNHFPLLVPCHRVIQSNGKLGGFSCGLEIKKRLLEFEAGAVLPRYTY